MLLKEYKESIGSLSLIPSSGGVFEIKLDDEVIFSKKNSGRFPDKGEVKELLKKRI